MVLSEVSQSTDGGQIQKKFLEFLMDFRVGNEYIYKRRMSEMVANRERSLVVDFEHLIEQDDALARAVQNNPDVAMPFLKKALLEALRVLDPEYFFEIRTRQEENQKRKGDVKSYTEAAALIPLNIRLKMPQGSVARLRELGAQHIDKLVQVEAVALRVAVAKPYLEIPIYKCVKCGEKTPGIVGLTEVFAPQKCMYPSTLEEGRACMGPLTLDAASSYSINHQRVLLQERQEELTGGVLPRGVQALITDDLVDKLKPGSRVRATGIFRAYQHYKAQGERALETFLDLNYFEGTEKEFESFELSGKDLEEIRKMSLDPWLKVKLVESIAPGIYGMGDVKEAVLLALVGAPAVTLPDGTRVRGDSHILLLGDPGTGKSQLLQAVSKLVPRGIYTSGKGSSGVGLTAAVIRDQRGEFMLEAGAMVLADSGVCLLDELDKMDENDRSAIHEALEQQTITISKAGIHATLNARCGVISAGNPTFGKYQRERSVADNINLPPTILSRFDLIFIIEDKPDEKRDKELADFVLKVRGQGQANVPYTSDVIRKYLAYARHNIFPELSPEAADRLNSFYSEMRRKSESPDSPVVITTRQLEGLVRLTKAHARLRLSRTAVAADADAAIRLYNVFLEGIGVRVGGAETSDLNTISMGRTTRELNLMQRLDRILSSMIEQAGPDGVLEADFRQKALEQEFTEESITKFLKLKRADNVIFEPKPGRISRVKV